MQYVAEMQMARRTPERNADPCFSSHTWFIKAQVKCDLNKIVIGKFSH